MPAAEAAPVIEPPDDKASLGVEHVTLDVVEQVGLAVAVGDHLQRRTGVPVHDHRVFFIRVEILRLDDLGVQVAPSWALRVTNSRCDLGQIQRGPGALAQHAHLGPVGLEDRRDGRRRDVGELVHQVLPIAGEGAEVEPGRLRYLFHFAAGDIHAVDLPLQGAVLRRREVGPLAGRVDVDRAARDEQVPGRGVDHPFALR